MPAGFGGGTNEEEQRERLRKQAETSREAFRKFNAGEDPGGGTSGGYEAILKEEARQKRVKAEAESLRRGREEYLRRGGTFYTGKPKEKAPAPQRVVVQQQAPWSGPPLPPIKIAGRPLPGASNAVFVLGFGLAAVASWQPFVKPLAKQMWGTLPGEPPPPKTTWPGGAVLALPLFVLLLVFIASLSPGAAQATLYFIVALWVVFLVMNPSLVQGAMAFFTQRNPATNSVAPVANPLPTGQGGTGVHVK